ncbi:MAG: SUMF1/EgtB/PvdO family nonheme iron enzyme [Woeseiaceae bacterium]
MGNFFSELKRRKVLRVAAAYIVSSWVLLQVADLLTDILELPEWAPKLVFLILVVGFVPALILSWAFDVTPEGLRGEAGEPAKGPIALALLLVVAGLLAGGWWYSGKDARWARDEGIGQVEALVASDDKEAAYRLARRVDALLPGNADMEEVWNSFAWSTSIVSEPEGAEVFWRPYENVAAEWLYLGTTPLHDIRIPAGVSVLSIKKDGYDPLLRVVGGMVWVSNTLGVDDQPSWNFANVFPGGFKLHESGQMPDDMVFVPGWTDVIDDSSVEFREFFIGRFEVSNSEYQEFVDAGGYRRKDLWEHEFVDDGVTLSFEEAMARFVDVTGRPGPSTWEAGAFPEGEGDFPVTGLSWYEAAAYARFRDRRLPSIHHWSRAMATGLLAWELPASNVDGERLARVGEFMSIGWTGTFDMAGNAREWCFNEATDGMRTLLGAAWSDATYMVEESLSEPHRMPPFDRSATNGLRLMQVNEEARAMEFAARPVELFSPPPIPDPVSDEVFAAMLSDFDYDRGDLNAVIEEDIDFRYWKRQRITFDGEPGEDRIIVYLYLPHTDRSRHQTIMLWPGAATQIAESVDDLRFILDFLLRNGRAVAMPVVKGMFERRVSPRPDWTTHRGRNLAIEEVREFRRAIDYLETRQDIRADVLGYYGHSWGGRVGAIVLAVEPRLKVGVLNQAGINAGDHPDINVSHFLPRVDAPVLHFSGRYDTDFRFESSSKPFFDRLGTLPEHKKHVVADSGHFVPLPIVKGEALDWLDKYLGPVE